MSDALHFVRLHAPLACLSHDGQSWVLTWSSPTYPDGCTVTGATADVAGQKASMAELSARDTEPPTMPSASWPPTGDDEGGL